MSSVGKAKVESKRDIRKGRKKNNSFDQFLRLQILFSYKSHIVKFLELSSVLMPKASMMIYGNLEPKRGHFIATLFHKAWETDKKRSGIN